MERIISKFHLCFVLLLNSFYNLICNFLISAVDYMNLCECKHQIVCKINYLLVFSVVTLFNFP